MNNMKSPHYLFLVIALILSRSVGSFAQTANEKYIVDKKESVITWSCAMQFAPQNAHMGYIYMSAGELLTEKGKLSGGTVAIDMNTMQDERHESDNDLIDHLKSPDFFDAENFPVSNFAITGVTSGEGGNIKITGNLTIKGITHEITFPGKFEVTKGVLSASGKVTIDRAKWDVRYGSGKFFENLANDTISDEITVNMKIVARKG